MPENFTCPWRNAYPGSDRGNDSYPCEISLVRNDIEDRHTRVRRPKRNGLLERFNRSMLDEFLRTAFSQRIFETVETLQKDLHIWLEHYNTERQHQCSRNL